MKKMTKFFALALLAGAMVSCSTEDTASTTANGKVAVQFTGGISVNTRASGTTWDNGDRIGITDIGNDTRYGNVPFILKNGKFEAEGKVIYFEDTKTHTFRAYYPYNAAGGILTATTDATAQQNQPAIDFLFASGATGDKHSPVVSFTDKTGKGGENNSLSKEEVDGRLVLLRRGIGRGCEDASRRVVRIVGAESMGLCIFDIDDFSFCLKFPVLQDERHVAVLGIVADVGDADTVTVVPSGSAGAGGEGDVGGKLGGHRVTV